MSGKKYFDKRNPKGDMRLEWCLDAPAGTFCTSPHSPCYAGEIAEWKTELADRHRQKDALKKIIAAMTIGKDVSSVFAEVTSCSQTTDLEVKKLVYLYLINYAKSQPELAIMAVNTFVKVCFQLECDRRVIPVRLIDTLQRVPCLQDSNDTNPMLRALAIRTMGCIRVDRITEYLCDPLEKALKVRLNVIHNAVPPDSRPFRHGIEAQRKSKIGLYRVVPPHSGVV